MSKIRDIYKLYSIIKKKNYTIILVNCNKYIFLKKYKNKNVLLKIRTLKNRRLLYLFSKVVLMRYIYT